MAWINLTSVLSKHKTYTDAGISEQLMTKQSLENSPLQTSQQFMSFILQYVVQYVPVLSTLLPNSQKLMQICREASPWVFWTWNAPLSSWASIKIKRSLYAVEIAVWAADLGYALCASDRKITIPNKSSPCSKGDRKQGRLSRFPTYTVCCLFASNNSPHLSAFHRLIITFPKRKNFLTTGEDHPSLSRLYCFPTSF